MKRFVFYAFSFLFLVLTAAYIEGAPTLVEDTKHNLSSNPANANAIKSSLFNGTSEICVFCHTPHSARPDAPLWNRTNSTASYTNTYWSDVLAGLSYPTPEDPSNTGLPNYAIHVKTRICLSCHDGTIALGSLVNLPSSATSGEIQMVGTTGSLVANGMPTAAAGYIGTDFRDDHPVAVKYLPSGTGPDPEMKGSGSRPAELKLYASGGFDYIECTTCHNAHDNQYGNFLVMTNDNSALCMGCHDKTGYDPSSVHSVATQSYSPSNGTAAGSLGTTVGNVDCMSCHFPHKAGITDKAQLPKADDNPAYGAYLLSFQEEQSCYNSPDRWNNSTAPCHGDNGQAVKNIKSLVAASKPSRHQVDMNGTALHEAAEARGVASGWLGGGNAKWHVECADCHNPHTAGSATRTQINPNNPIVPPVPTSTLPATSPLYGTGGVRVDTWPNNWNTPNAGGTFTYLEPIGVVDTLKNATGAQYEYQICLKCHSNFAWPVTPPNAPSLSASMTNQALEFNPANTYAGNASAHPVAGSTGHTDGTLSGNWNNAGNKGNQTMYCSDCHNNNLAPPQGPHGSNNQAILYRTYTNTYGPTNGGQGQQQPGGDICLGCHPQAVYLLLTPAQNVLANGSTGFASSTNINLHAQHQWRAAGNSGVANLRSYRCVNCHTRVSHGWKRKGLIVFRGDGVPFGTSAVAYEAGGANSALIDNTSTLNASGNYSFTKGIDCTTANAIGCHQ